MLACLWCFYLPDVQPLHTTSSVLDETHPTSRDSVVSRGELSAADMSLRSADMTQDEVVDYAQWVAHLLLALHKLFYLTHSSPHCTHSHSLLSLPCQVFNVLKFMGFWLTGVCILVKVYSYIVAKCNAEFCHVF